MKREDINENPYVRNDLEGGVINDDAEKKLGVFRNSM